SRPRPTALTTSERRALRQAIGAFFRCYDKPPGCRLVNKVLCQTYSEYILCWSIVNLSLHQLDVFCRNQSTRGTKGRMRPTSVRVAALAVLLMLWSAPGDTQTALRTRIAGPIDEANVAVVRGTTHPLAQARFDRGRTPVDRVIQAAITFRLSTAQQ